VLNAQVGAAADSESRMLLKTIRATTGRSSRRRVASRGQPELHRPDFAAFPGKMAKRPAAPLVRDEGPAVPAACPIGRSTPGTYRHHRTTRYTGSPANRQADPLREPTL
jgi:hypothetical protein